MAPADYVIEGYDNSGNRHDKKDKDVYRYTYDYYYDDYDKGHKDKGHKDKDEYKKDWLEEHDKTLIYLGIGAATLGAAVIIMVSLRK
jgi:hypothetical protein